ncbi:ABC transporter permease subunit [Terrilactibacillus sp. BCM23-1]|uniref:ABC transporter permease subunit n=1 Tax=Terrilactibacillus tamarindi TaxID=2599694 RepID=A0A6N8CS54_9BACI|nr:carbohydrate ABC transporter permease [Terrilactibacillus tamarindi]MTT31893.1 ABC transporter permease subunit [Terrilactibacillus tamarindi]
MMAIKRGSLYVVLILIALLLFFPIIYAFLVSFMSTKEVLMGHLIPKSFSLTNYIDAFQALPLLHSLINSMLVSIITTIGQIIVCSLAAYAFVFIEFRGRQFLFFLFVSTMMIPWEASIIPNFVTVQKLGWINHYAALTIPFFATAFGTFLLRQHFKTIPKELHEASRMAGLGHLTFFLKVVMPVSKTSLVTLGIYCFLTTWNSYLWPLLVTTDERSRTAQIGLRQLHAQENVTQWGVVMAGVVIVAIPTLLVLFLGQKHLQKGLMDGAVK